MVASILEIHVQQDISSKGVWVNLMSGKRMTLTANDHQVHQPEMGFIASVLFKECLT